MDQRQEFLTKLLHSPDMRRFFPCEPEQPEESGLFRIFEQLWPIVREASTTDEECVENIETLIRIAVSLAGSGRMFG